MCLRLYLAHTSTPSLPLGQLWLASRLASAHACTLICTHRAVCTRLCAHRAYLWHLPKLPNHSIPGPCTYMQALTISSPAIICFDAEYAQSTLKLQASPSPFSFVGMRHAIPCSPLDPYLFVWGHAERIKRSWLHCGTVSWCCPWSRPCYQHSAQYAPPPHSQLCSRIQSMYICVRICPYLGTSMCMLRKGWALAGSALSL